MGSEELEKIINSLQNTSKVVSVEMKSKIENPPSLYSYIELLADGCDLLGISFHQVASACKHLYEAKLITFPAVFAKKLHPDFLPQFEDTIKFVSLSTIF